MQQELARLSAQLENSCTISDVHHVRSTMRKIHTFITRGQDLSPLASKILKFISYPDAVVKKVVFYFIMRYRHKQEIGLLALNALLKDTKDPNPLYRALAVSTLVCVPSISEQGISEVLLAQDDPSPHVRRDAICCCSELCRRHPADFDPVDRLYAAIRDTDPIVVAMCLCTLEDVLRSEGGIMINKKMAHHLLDRLGTFHRWGLVCVLNFLKKYKPQNDEEVLVFVNAIDEYLVSDSAAVQLSAFELFQSMVSGRLDHLLQEGLVRVWSKLRIQLAFSEEETAEHILTWVEPFIKSYPHVFMHDWRRFYCRFRDSASTKCKKIGILQNLADKDTAVEITEELLGYCTYEAVLPRTLRTLANFANDFPTLNEVVVPHLLLLLNVPEESVMSEALSAICHLNVVNESNLRHRMLESVLGRLRSLTSPSAKCTVLGTISRYGKDFEASPYILEEYIEDLVEDEDVVVKETLLTAAVQLFFERPAEMQDTLGVLLDKLCADECPFVRRHATTYYNVLSANVEFAERIFKS